jgi:hypothetical protein
MNLLQRPVTTKPPKQKKDPGHLGRVAELGCCICQEYGMQQLSATQVHHCIHGRYGFRKAPDHETIPLCEGHHQGNFDTSKIALHRAPHDWQVKYGPDTRWISWVEKRLGKDEA